MLNNPSLFLVVAGCRRGKTDRLRNAVKPLHFIGHRGEVNHTGADVVFRYVVDLVNNGHSSAAQECLSSNGGNVSDPDNKDVMGGN